MHRANSKAIVTIGVVALVLATLEGCAAGASASKSPSTSKPITMALIEVGPDAFSTAQTDAFVKEAKAKGYKYTTYNAQNSPTQMVSEINQAVSQKVDGIVIQAADSISAEAPIRAADKAGICTAAVTVPIGTDDTKVFPGMKAYVGWNGVSGGRYEGEGLAKLMNGAGGVVIIQGSLANGSASERQAGAEAVWKEKYPNIQVLETVQTQFDNTKVVSDMKDLITKYGSQIKGVLSITDPMAAAAATVINGSALKGKVAVMGFAGQGAFVNMITSGQITGATVPEAPGSEVVGAMQQLVSCIGGNKTPVYVNQTDLPTIAKLKDNGYVLDKSNASQFTPQW